MNDVTTNVMTQVKIGEVRFSYAYVFDPRPKTNPKDENERRKWGAAILIPKTDKKSKAACETAIDAAIVAGQSELGGISNKAQLKMPFHDGDIDKAGTPDEEAYAGHWYFSANCTTQPGVLVRQAGKNVPITDPKDFYSGCYGFVSINFYAFKGKQKGIAAGLNNIVKTRNGDYLGGKINAEEDFADMDLSEYDEEEGIPLG